MTQSSRRRWPWLLGILVVLGVMFVLGPRTSTMLPPIVPVSVPDHPNTLIQWLAQREGAAGHLRPDTKARIIWADPLHPARAGCAMVYLHGFTASQGEGAPAHVRLARAFGCNLYLPRLPGHGLQPIDALRGVDAVQLRQAAAEALAVARVLGERVVVIGTSMGGALATQAVAADPRQVQALVLWSPLVRERDEQLRVLGWPWGSQLLVWVKNSGDPVMRWPVKSAYWASGAHLDGYRALYTLSRGGMHPSVYAQVRVPVFVGYYYRDAQHQDSVISVEALRTMFTQFGTPLKQRQLLVFPEADDHVIASPLRSRAASQVFTATCRFIAIQGGLHLVPTMPDCDRAWAD
ncbi:alpha/beta fold hydrolase [Xylella taiwanensis]|uniref:Alpha/beta fold hydrolase n=2 Tax=Xylella taiwanensis TaxID=1444770 RepID=A0ABS8TSL9_9GAMM|nr:alpha/beta fold hydrolase [Xylella taiwanensis]AXI82758.1 membrane protein [Xylella taiwanensis]MCD8455764.1 alpha/beta fold hydrolase [Xylella taiwanensis]MCD8458169.1 alpha/beta fold hydrolase [Xylella taiwanensis]MCD8460305.1 alpha/beta fold hydrolase [Xylella taiwanensis]MCD8463637.1 alpha/beta fold hydrolase [Xylella taiwanensis]